MNIFGYMRISTKEKQTTDRQELALLNYAKGNKFTFDEIISEKVSGTVKADQRPGYSKLKEKLRMNDVIVLTDMDRLGRDADDVIQELKNLKEMKVKIVALDMPYMNEWNIVEDNSLNDMVIDITITIKAHMAQQERERIVSRINQGLAATKEKGTKLGRPKASLPAYFTKEYKKYLTGEYGKISVVKFAKMLGIGRATVYKYIKIYNEV